MVSLALPLMFGFFGQSAPPDQASPAEAAARLEFMKQAVASYKIHLAADPTTVYALQPEPVLRFTNPISGVPDGVVFFWCGQSGRPEATVQVYQARSGNWAHEFTSLSTSLLAAEGGPGFVWRPGGPGVEFRAIPDAPAPAESVGQRLRQMHALAREFTVEDAFQGKGWHSLRLMARPLAVYGKPGSNPADGALFSFALGTNPEAFLMIESRIGPNGPEWQFALARMSGWALKGTHRGQEVWNLASRANKTGSNDPFYVFRPRTGP
jgi:hypothetical protein